MQIDKILIIDSPVHLWRLIRSKEEIIDQAPDGVFSILNIFMDCTDNYINGCKCDKEELYEIMNEQYNTSIRREDVISHLIKGFECDKIEFK